MSELPDNICPRPQKTSLLPSPTWPLAPPIFPAAVYCCDSPDQADRLLGAGNLGFVYSRDAHPNAQLLAEKCRALHAAEQATVCASGMAALGLAALSHAQTGDHVVVSHRLYGRTQVLFARELPRLGIRCSIVDVQDEAALHTALESGARLLLVETISNPLLSVPDLRRLAEAAHSAGALLLVDNTFAGPCVCRPLEWGADLVMESLTKIMNGHSDVLLGLLCGRTSAWERVAQTHITWGATAGPFECWLADRGLSTLALRSQRASANALQIARFLQTHPGVARVYYPGLPDHLDHEIARRQFREQFGSMIAFELGNGSPTAGQFIARVGDQIPFAPSLCDVSTTLSHPASTSHRGYSPEERAALGITDGMIRLSVGIESVDTILAGLSAGLTAL